MESQISHNLACLLTPCPKGYSIKMLNKILKIRLLYKNNQNLKLLYLHNYTTKEFLRFIKIPKTLYTNKIKCKLYLKNPMYIKNATYISIIIQPLVFSKSEDLCFSPNAIVIPRPPNNPPI